MYFVCLSFVINRCPIIKVNKELSMNSNVYDTEELYILRLKRGTCLSVPHKCCQATEDFKQKD